MTGMVATFSTDRAGRSGGYGRLPTTMPRNAEALFTELRAEAPITNAHLARPRADTIRVRMADARIRGLGSVSQITGNHRGRKTSAATLLVPIPRGAFAMNLDQLYHVAILLKDGSVLMVPRSRPGDVWWQPVLPIRLRPGERHVWGAQYPMQRDVRKILLLAQDDPESSGLLRMLADLLELHRPWGRSPANLIGFLSSVAVMEREKAYAPWRLPRRYRPRLPSPPPVVGTIGAKEGAYA